MATTTYSPSETEIQSQIKQYGVNRDAAIGNLMTANEQTQRSMNQTVATPPPTTPPAIQPPAAPVTPPTPVPQEKPAPTEQAAPAKTEATTEQPTQYKISAGDNLTKIAQRYGVGVSDILAINPQIKNPNMIFAGQSLAIPKMAAGFKMPTGYEQINGLQYSTTESQQANFSDIKTDPTGTFLYGRKTDPSSSINDQAQVAYDLLENTNKLAEDTTIRKSEKQKMIEAQVEETLGISKSGDVKDDTIKTSDGSVIDIKENPSALSMYKELMQSPDIRALQTSAGSIQEKLDKIEASEVAFRNDILKEVEGEAPQSYIDAMVAERMKDLYPQKLALSAELRNVVGQLQGEKENAANILQFSLQDENNRYNRMVDYLQYQAQQGQVDFSNKLALMNYVKDLPPDRSVTINGTEYKGMAEDANLSVIQFTDENNNITLVGLDKLTGEQKYKQIIGRAPASKSGTAGDPSFVKQYNEEVAKQNLDILQGSKSGKYKLVVDPDDEDSEYLVDNEKYQKAIDDYENDPTNNDYIPWNSTSEKPHPKDYAVDSPSQLK